MKRIFVFIILSLLMAISAFSYTIKESPYNSMFYIGLTSGLGAGIDFGLDFEFEYAKLKIGVEVEQLVTDVDYEQNVNISKLGLLYKIDLTESVYLSLHGGMSSFFAPLPITYTDIFSGKTYTTPTNFNGRMTYYGLGVNIRVSDYIVTPAVNLNTIVGGGTLMGIQLNVGHKI